MINRELKLARPIYTQLVADVLKINNVNIKLKLFKDEEVLNIAGVCEIIHNGSLIHDDIEDNRYYYFIKSLSIIRRKDHAIHIKYGTDISINLGSLLYIIPTNYLIKSSKASDKIKL